MPAAFLFAAALAAAATPLPAPGALPGHVPTDSIPALLRRIESGSPRPRDRADAALLLGRYHYARGEYREALDDFARAAARMDPSQKAEPLYWTGLCWLGLRGPNAARAALEEVASTNSPRRAEARLGIARAWDGAGRPDRAYETLGQLLADDPGEAGASALELYAALADRLGHPGDATRARARLMSEYPESLEAAAALAAAANADLRPPDSGPVTLEAGVFASRPRARALAGRAARSGFRDARVIEHGEGASRTYGVVLGTYPGEAEAREAQARATRELGVTARLGSAR